MRLVGILVGLTMLASMLPQDAQAEVRSFEDCLTKVRDETASLGSEPAELLNVETVRIVQFRTPENVITIICNKVSVFMLRMVSTHKCGPPQACGPQTRITPGQSPR